MYPVRFFDNNDSFDIDFKARIFLRTSLRETTAIAHNVV